ncbi:GTF2IRD2 [Cordylochernes scorpioides]|uniref:GTF2IRD2 n=1 Tax=Cordylochernes scorpioides TaxID=51811 RepID=A0ABY6L5N6_9ARAC|nr:GTF2IRD2 [Cordylochernes scorpioides]
MPGHRKRRQFKQTDAFTRGMVIGLKRAGWSIRQIAADTHLGASTVHRLWRRWLEQGNVAIYRNVGATRVTSARVDRRILRQAVAAPQATCTAILQHVQDTLDHSISTRTISRRLVANGLHSCRPLRRLPLTPPNRRQRLEWCRARSTWMTEWHRVVFSDESRFCLSSDSRRVRVWRRGGERSNPAAIVERPTVRQRGIMVWGAIAYDSRSPLLRIQGTITAQRYVDDVLRPVTLPYLQGVPNALYQQDNARPHTARISQQALQDVQMLPWPPYSPDLSPIEHVWDIIGRRLHALPQPRLEDELWQMVEREWRAIPQDAIRTLIDSLPRRVAECIAVRACDTDFNIFEELLELVPMHGTTTGEDIFNCVYDLLQKYNLPQSKLTSVATDGAPSMTGKNNGFVALLRKKLSEISDGSNIHHTHCIIHQEVLCTKDLKEEICQFLITKNQDITLFSDQVWLQDFSYMVDITKHLSDFNLKLQGKDQIITNMCDQVNAFKCKLVLWEKQLKNEDLMHFPTCNMYKSSLGETASYQKYAEKNLSLRNEFETRFSDFKSLEGKFTLFSSIFSINIESVLNHMQMEVIDIQCDSDLKAKFIEVGVSEFYKYLPARFENTRILAYEIMSMFGSTYRCEQLFSLMKGNKSPIRSRITDVHLGSVLKLITANKISPEVGKVVAEKRCQISGRKYKLYFLFSY